MTIAQQIIDTLKPFDNTSCDFEFVAEQTCENASYHSDKAVYRFSDRSYLNVCHKTDEIWVS